MKYKIGDIVTVISISPKDKNTVPYWINLMNNYLGKQITITKISEAEQWYSNGKYFFREEWFEDSQPAYTLNERICNKIKQLDTKWKERDSKFA